MATRWLATLTGTVTWGSAASWSATDGGATGASVPVSADSVRINRGNATIPGQDLSAVVLADMIVSAPVTFGTSGVPFLIGFANPAAKAAVLSFIGDYGDTYFGPVCAGTNCVVQFSGGGNVWLSGATAQGEHIFSSGRVQIGATYTNSTAGNFPVTVLGGKVFFDAGTSNAVNIDVQDGAAYSARPVGTATVSGRLTTTGTATVTASTVFPNGTHIHQSSGVVTMITVKANGKASDAGATAPFTVTNATGYGNAVIFTTGNPLITYTNPKQYFGGGPGEGPA